MISQPNQAHPDAPLLPLQHLETLWIQITGTLCNLACLHCFISCGPKNTTHRFIPIEQIKQNLDEALQYGVKEIYYTGGEPFLHPDIKAAIEYALEIAPLSILTNGTLIDDEMAAWLGKTFKNSYTSLDIRVSLDGLTPDQNDRIRGRGSYDKIIKGIKHLAKHGISPVITVTECIDFSPFAGPLEHAHPHEVFKKMLKELGIEKPRLKFLPPFKIGREERRDRPYRKDELLYEGEVNEEAIHYLQCAKCRMITSKGVYPCPILINDPDSRMGNSLSDGLQPIRLRHPACYTCYVDGVSCRT